MEEASECSGAVIFNGFRTSTARCQAKLTVTKDSVISKNDFASVNCETTLSVDFQLQMVYVVRGENMCDIWARGIN